MINTLPAEVIISVREYLDQQSYIHFLKSSSIAQRGINGPLEILRIMDFKTLLKINNPSLVKTAIEYNLIPNDKKHKTLRWAIHHSYHDIIDMLSTEFWLDHPWYDIDAAILTKNTDTVHLVIQKLVELKTDKSYKYNLYNYICTRRPNTVDILKYAMDHIDNVDEVDLILDFVLQQGVTYGRLDMVELVFEHGPREIPPGLVRTATIKDYKEIKRLLIQNGARPWNPRTRVNTTRRR